MQITIAAGKYVLAVSGGVDSMALLDMLGREKNLELVVAHFNHGIRAAAAKDEDLVERAAKNAGLKFEIGHGNLGQNASEEKARAARYKFLQQIKKKHRAKAIITAHHQDDLIETAFLNILRGTGYKGVATMTLNPEVVRPLLRVPKKELVSYAKTHKLQWHEDATNSDTRYLRNYIRSNIMPLLSATDREAIIVNIDKIAKLEPKITELTAKLSQKVIDNEVIDRHKFTMLPALVASELVVRELRRRRVRDFDKKTIERLSTIIKTGKANTKHNVQNTLWLKLKNKSAYFTTID